MPVIFYVEDEPFLAKVVVDTLILQGFEVLSYQSGKLALANWHKDAFDIAVLDVMLPDMDGFELARRMREEGCEAPMMFLTARSFTADVLKGFEVGGTDYLRKPFSMEELIARIQVQLTWVGKQIRQKQEEDNDRIIQLNSFSFRPKAMQLIKDDATIRLSYKENHILTLLAGNVNQITDRKQLLLAVWGDDSFFNSRTLDVYIRKLRTHFAGDPGIQLLTLKGKGYLLRTETEHPVESDVF